jgi:flagellar biosynthesis/type III secretory pathway protein FliH
MTFDRLLYIDRLKEAGIEEPVARAHAEALREALLETVATKNDLNEAVQTLKAEAVSLDRKIEITARDLTIKGAGGLIIIATLIVGLKLFG